MISYGHQFIDEDDLRAVLNVLRSDWLTQGPKVEEFEKKLAKYCGSRYAVVTSSGTSALHLAYLVAGLKNGNEVITTPNTFVATTNMLLTVGAKPVFCDIRSDTYNIDESKIEALITDQTKAIIPVHFAGQPCEMDEIAAIAKKHNLLVIEDACHALGASYHGRKIGSLSDMTVFSFHPIKTITTGEGGAILTDNENYYQRLILLRSHGVNKNEQGKNVMTELGYNYRLTDIGAALGISQLKKIDNFISKRHKLVKLYENNLKDNLEIILPHEFEHNYSSWHLYVIRVKDASRKNNLASYLKENGVGINFHYQPVYSQPYYQDNGYRDTVCQISESYFEAAITLPLHPLLTVEEVNFICDKIKSFFNK